MGAEENYKALRAELDEWLSSNKQLAAIAEKISAGKADFSDTARYSQIVSRIMGEVISQHIGEITVPLGKQMVCKELLKDHYKAINDILGEVQASVDDKLGIHLNPVKAPFPTERIDKAAHSLEDPTVPQETIMRRARSATENIANSMHDDYIKENAKTRTQAGLKCYLVRDAGGGCCKWCQALEGRYDYATAPDDIFRRHDNCTCSVTYECGRQRQDVWSKKTWEATPEELKARKEAEAASKPVVNSKEQAKELEAEIIGPKTNDTVNELSESVLKQVTEWEKENFSNSSEKGLLIMPDGTTKEFGGIEHSVTGKKEDIKLMNGAIFTHNHPTDNTFSSTDIVTGLVKGNLKEMRAVTITGDVHILVNNGATEIERRKFSAEFQQRVMKAGGIADKKIRKGERINKDEYIKERLEKFMQEHANEYNLSYTKTNLNELSIDNGVKSGIIREKANRPIAAITDQAIKSVPVVEVSGYSYEDSLIIQQQHKDLLDYSRENNNNGECSFTFREGFSDRKEFIGSDDSVDFGSDGLNGSNLFVMHNHPRNSSYSDRDVRFLLENENIKALSIVKNNGHVEVLVKNQDFSIKKAKTELGRFFKKYVMNNTDEEIDRAITAFVKSGKGGLTWITK